MAQHTVVTLTDDLDGGTATDTIEFSLDSKSYEIDLSDDNINKLRGALAPFLAAARKAGSSSTPRRQALSGSTSSGRPREENAEIRRWLNDHGYTVAARGRLSAAQVEAWESKTPAPKDGKDAVAVSGDAASAPEALAGGVKAKRTRKAKAQGAS